MRSSPQADASLVCDHKSDGFRSRRKTGSVAGSVCLRQLTLSGIFSQTGTDLSYALGRVLADKGETVRGGNHDGREWCPRVESAQCRHRVCFSSGRRPFFGFGLDGNSNIRADSCRALRRHGPFGSPDTQLHGVRDGDLANNFLDIPGAGDGVDDLASPRPQSNAVTLLIAHYSRRAPFREARDPP
jgi:hypothetical protein